MTVALTTSVVLMILIASIFIFNNINVLASDMESFDDIMYTSNIRYSKCFAMKPLEMPAPAPGEVNSPAPTCRPVTLGETLPSPPVNYSVLGTTLPLEG